MTQEVRYSWFRNRNQMPQLSNLDRHLEELLEDGWLDWCTICDSEDHTDKTCPNRKKAKNGNK
jgi:hypothetical protein